MDGHTDLLTVAALLERAYRLALVLQDDASTERDPSRFVASELVDVLDDARVTLLRAAA